MNLFKTLIILLCCFTATSLSAQKSQIKKANSFYKLNKYKDAIVLYEEALSIKDNLNASSKLAYCYRMTNQMVKAETQYAKVVEHDKAKSKTYFYYAESLMSNGKYDQAKSWFLKYNEREPNDQNAVRMAYACEKVKTLVPYFKNVDVKDFEHNSDVDDSGPVRFNGGIVFTSDRSTGVNPLKKKSGWTGRDYLRIYFSKEKENGTYGNPGNFSKKLNDLNKHCGPVSFTEDKKTVVFTRTGETSGKNNTYNIQLYIAESEDGKKWKGVKVLPFCNKDFNYMHPALSPDGSKLFFVSDKRGGLGGTDIYLSKRDGDKWSRPQNLGPVINTSANEAFPFYHKSDKLFFSSKGHLSYGGFDILFSNLKENATWQKPVNVGKPINSSYDDVSMYLDEGLESGMFASSRNGGDDDIYIFKINEGVNAELESLDFEGLVDYERPTQEEEYVGGKEVDTPSPSGSTETSLANTASEIKTEVEERPMKNLEGTIRNDNTLEEIREEQSPDIVSIPVPDQPSTNIPTNEDKLETPVIAIEEKKEVIESVEIVEEVIDEPTSIMDRAPVEEEIVEEVVIETPPMENRTEEVAIVEEVNNRKTLIEEAPARSLPTNEEVETSIVENTTIENTKKPKSINLIIPSKKEPAQPREPEQIEEPAIVEEVVVEEPVKEIVSEVIKKEEQIEVKEPVVDSPFGEGESILDQEPMEPKPPVMLGDESSSLSDKVEKLPALGELMQMNKAIPTKGFVVDGLSYAKGSYLLSPEDTRSLAVVIDLMDMYPSLKIEVGSHTSSRGDDVTNHNLSRKRAMSIMAFLAYKGVAEDRMTAKGYGETQLLNHCSNGADCSKVEHEENDRIEVKVIK